VISPVTSCVNANADGIIVSAAIASAGGKRDGPTDDVGGEAAEDGVACVDAATAVGVDHQVEGQRGYQDAGAKRHDGGDDALRHRAELSAERDHERGSGHPAPARRPQP
jgi:hypothetical protein